MNFFSQGQTSLERENSTVEVFGRWQTEVYVPPPVVDVRYTISVCGL